RAHSGISQDLERHRDALVVTMDRATVTGQHALPLELAVEPPLSQFELLGNCLLHVVREAERAEAISDAVAGRDGRAHGKRWVHRGRAEISGDAVAPDPRIGISRADPKLLEHSRTSRVEGTTGRAKQEIVHEAHVETFVVKILAVDDHLLAEHRDA